MYRSFQKTNCHQLVNGTREYNGTVLILTLAKHRTGVWVTELLRNLQLLRPKLKFLITDLDHHNVSESLLFSDRNIAIINRVSDAAPPVMVKRALTVLRMAEMQGIKVLLNGCSAYTVGMSKVAHHAAIHAAGCKTPRSTIITQEMELSDVKRKVKEAKLTFPILLKPNAAGFGKGITRLGNMQELDNIDWSFPSGDGVMLLQEELVPDSEETYRCFVLGNRLQCAVAVKVQRSSYGGACAASAQPYSMRAWVPPSEITQSCLSIMQICQADCGSVELLFYGGEAFFFDVNMLSTLPSPQLVTDANKHWPLGFDPWQELAEYANSKL